MPPEEVAATYVASEELATVALNSAEVSSARAAVAMADSLLEKVDTVELAWLSCCCRVWSAVSDRLRMATSLVIRPSTSRPDALVARLPVMVMTALQAWSRPRHHTVAYHQRST